ncbi:MAG TPA: PAS domain S-box protein [Spirochaetota bacterium]|nr:PAS domain S-box protein [Spirochaetota bacterium]
MTWHHIAYLISVFVAGFVMAGIALYSRKNRASVAGAGVYQWIALLVSIVAFFQAISMLGPTDEWALFWFNARFPCFAVMPVLWLLFVFHYVGKPRLLTNIHIAALLLVPLATEAMLWTSPWHDLWVVRETAFSRAGPFFMPETSVRVPGPFFIIHTLYTNLVFLAGLAVLFVMSLRMKRGHRAQAAWLGAGTLVMLVGALIPTFSLAPGMKLNLLPQGLAAGSLMIAWGVFRHRFLAETVPVDRGRPIPVTLVALFFALTAGIVTAGFVNYIQFRDQHREQMEQQLQSIADLKVENIIRWRRERLGDGVALRDNALLSALVRRLAADPFEQAARWQVYSWLETYQKAYGYDSIFLLDKQGAPLFAVEGSIPSVRYHTSEYLEQARRSGQVILTDFHRERPCLPIHLSVIVPLNGPPVAHAPYGYIVMVIDPNRQLYPAIKQWPIQSRTGETLLVRKDGDSALYLNELRFRKNSAFNIRIPLSKTEVPAVMAVLGKSGIVEGLDYRGVPVLAALRAVPESPWFMVARLDAEEVFAPVRERFWYMVVVMLGLTGAAGAGTVLLWRRRDERHAREMLRSAEELRESEEKFRSIFEYSTEGKSLIAPDGRLLQVNRAFADMLGYSIEEMQKVDFVRLTHPEDLAESRECVRLLLAGERDRYRMEKRYIHRNGSVVWADVSTTLHRNGAGAPEYFITSINNITERKRAEEKIREKDILFRKLSDSLPDMIFQFTRKPDGSYYVPISSQGISNIFGCQPEDVADSFDPIARVLHPDDAERVISDIEQSAVQYKPFTSEFRVLVPGKPVQWILSRSTPEKLDDGSITWYGFCANITDRKRAEEELHALFSRQEALLGAIPDIVMEVDANKVYTWANRAGRDFFGEDVVGREAAHYFVGEQETYERVRPLFEGEDSIIYLESLQRRKDGEERLLAWWCRVLKDEKGNVTGALSTARDITEQKHAEENIRRVNEVLSCLNRIHDVFLTRGYDDMYLGVLEVILDALKSEYGVFGYLDDAGALVVPTMTRTVWDRCQVAEKTFTFPEETWGDSSWPRAIREKRIICQNGISTLTPQGHVPIHRHVSVPIVHRDRAIGLIQVANKKEDYTSGDVTLLQSISDAIAPVLDARLRAERLDSIRRQAEEELRLVNESLEQRVRERTALLEEANASIIENAIRIEDLYNRAPCGYHSLDENGMFVEINDTELEWIGYSRDEVVGKLSFPDVITEDSRRTFEKNFPTFKERGFERDLEFEIVRKDGSTLPVLVTATAVRDADGRYVRSRSTVIDFSNVKRARDELARYAAKLEEANRDLESFSYSVSHDLRAPLRSIEGFSQVILEDYRDRLDDTGRDYLGRIRAATDRMARLIDDILKLSRLGQSEMRFETVDLAGLARAIMGELAARDPGRAVDVVIAENLQANGDPPLLRVVLENLLGNAWKFTSRTSGAKIEFGVIDGAGAREFFVRDNGAGFDMQYAGRLFGPFQRLHSAEEFEGTGIGLALVRRIISRHGCTVRAEGAVGKGATIYFTVGKNVDSA